MPMENIFTPPDADPERPQTSSSIQTLHPYTGGARALVGSRVDTPGRERTSARVPTYLDLKFDKKIDSLSCFVINREIDLICGGKPKKISQIRDDTLLIEVCRPDQAKRLLKDIKKIAGADMLISANKHLNHVKGVVYSKHLMHFSDDVLCTELGDQGVTEVQRIKKKVGSKLENTPMLILTLDLEKLPDKIYAAWHVLEVKPYVPSPRRCFQCQKFGHLGKWCRSTIAICVQCGESKLAEHSCTKTECANCKQSHQASDKNCDFYKMERETLSIKTNRKISYGQAKREVRQTQGPTPGGGYAKATKTTPPSQKKQKANSGAKPKEPVQQKEGPQAPEELLHKKPAPKEQRTKFAQVGQKTETALEEQQVKSAQSGQKAIAAPGEQQATKAAVDHQQHLAKAAEGDRQASAALEEQQANAVPKEPQATAVQEEQQASTAQKEQQAIAAPKEQQPIVAPKGPQAQAVPKGPQAKAAKPAQVEQPAKLTQVGQKAKPAKSAPAGQKAKPAPTGQKAKPAPSGQKAKPAPAGQKAKPTSAQGGQLAKNAGKSGTIQKQQKTGAGPRRTLSDVGPRSPNQQKTLLKSGIVPPPIRKVSNLPPIPSTKVGQSWQTDQPSTSKAQESVSKFTILKRRNSLPSPPVVKAPPLGASTPKHGGEPEESDDMDTTIIFDESHESASKRKRDSESSDKAPEEGEGKKPSSKKTAA